MANVFVPIACGDYFSLLPFRIDRSKQLTSIVKSKPIQSYIIIWIGCKPSTWSLNSLTKYNTHDTLRSAPLYSMVWNSLKQNPFFQYDKLCLIFHCRWSSKMRFAAQKYHNITMRIIENELLWLSIMYFIFMCLSFCIV